MIKKEEIDLKVKEFKIHRSNVERDYIFGWFLFGLFTISDLKENIFLKGGNALRKCYFENTRFSSDIDLGIPGDINQEILMTEINKVCDFIQNKTKILFSKEENRIDEKFSATDAPIPDLKVYEVRIYFKDFYGDADHLKIKISMDITRFDKVLLPIQNLDLIHPYSDKNQLNCKIRCMKLEEIIATKLKCILQRQHAPDLFDYVYSIKLPESTLNRKELIQTFIKKTIFSKNPHVVKEILIKTQFKYFKEMWTKTIICAKSIMFDVEGAIETFISDMEEIFKIYPNSGLRNFTFFEATLRLPIMEAGRAQTLLKVTYKNEERILEPYSLKYKERKDGTEWEYLYAYKLNGGKSEPGIRSFLAKDFQSIENTEKKFTPQYQIELCKAGEIPEKKYLFDQNKPAKRPKLKNIFNSYLGKIKNEIRYIYECNYCGKKFTKNKNTPIIRKHKTKGGYLCNSVYGYYIDTKYY
ncbi:MAG: nucleotidyl transferase AbiEii/AbiGii toxin family protein [Candidatus Magasanikbacteria bacterium]